MEIVQLMISKSKEARREAVHRKSSKIRRNRFTTPIACFAVILTGFLHAVPSSRISGNSYAERSDAFIRYLAAASPRNANFPKEAMPYYAARLQLGIDPEGTRKVIDVSGDGPDTTGAIPVERARDDAVARGFTINGLAIHRPAMPSLPDYFRTSIIGGPRSFVLRAESRATFADAILRKLILEIADLAPDRQQAQDPQGR